MYDVEDQTSSSSAMAPPKTPVVLKSRPLQRKCKNVNIERKAASCSKNLAETSETAETIANRTRSKQCLEPVPIVELGACLDQLQPDFSWDLYDPTVDFEQDSEWLTFLSQLSSEGLFGFICSAFC